MVSACSEGRRTTHFRERENVNNVIQLLFGGWRSVIFDRKLIL